MAKIFRTKNGLAALSGPRVIRPSEPSYRRRIREETDDPMLAEEAIAATEAFLDANPDCAF